MILINILEINQYFWISKNIDFRIDLAIDLGIDFETATFDQIWSNLIKFDQFWSNFPWFWSNLIKFDPIWSNLIKLQFLLFVPFLLIFHKIPCWFSIEKARLEINKIYWFCLRILIRINRWCPGIQKGFRASTLRKRHRR